MNRFEEIDNFLRYFSSLYQQNPSFEIKSDTIYYSLETYGMTEDEINNGNIINNFAKWEKDFKKTQRLVVYHDPRQIRFLQFSSNYKKDDNRYFKLYLNYSKDNIYESVNKVFSFVDKNRMESASKVADCVRADDVVLRLREPLEVAAVIDYVNRDSQLCNNARPTNPFVYRQGKVGIAYDDNLSYNSVISNMIAEYLNNRRLDNRLSEVSYGDFSNYINLFYHDNFKTAIGTNSFAKSQLFHKLKGRHNSSASAILNLEQIIKTLTLSLNPNTNYNDMVNHIMSCQNKKNYDDMLNYYIDVLKNPYLGNSSVQVDSNVNDNLDKAKRIIDNYILYISQEKDFDYTREVFKHIRQGEYNYITRTHDFRQLFSQNITTDMIDKIIGEDMNLYVGKLYSEVVSKYNNDSDLQEVNKTNTVNSYNNEPNVQTINKKDIFDRYVQLALIKYGFDIAIKQIQSYMSGNEYAITRDGNFRQLFVQYVSPYDISIITNNDLIGYVSLYYKDNEEVKSNVK